MQSAAILSSGDIMIKRFRTALRMYRMRGTATMPFWPWFRWCVWGKS